MNVLYDIMTFNSIKMFVVLAFYQSILSSPTTPTARQLQKAEVLGLLF